MKFFIILSILIVGMSACAQKVNEAVVETVTEDIVSPINKNVNAEAFLALINSGKGLLLDVRTPAEVAQGSIKKDVKNIDYYASDFKAQIDKLDRNTPIYVYCRSGSRSGKSMQIMTDMGFKVVYNLIGGYSNWPYK